MEFSLAELKNNLDSKIVLLGMTDDFRSNPAYYTVLSEIKRLLDQLNVDESTVVRIAGKTIFFVCLSSSGSRFSATITCAIPNNLVFSVTEDRPNQKIEDKTFGERDIVELIAMYDPIFKSISTYMSGSTVDNLNCEVNTCNNTSWSERKEFNAYGIMMEREYKGFPKVLLSVDKNLITEALMLDIPRQAFGDTFWIDKYNIRNVITRDKLDTAKVIYENKVDGERYVTMAPLSQKQSLRYLILPKGFETRPNNVTIGKLTEDQISELIKRETHPKVAMGLRLLTDGREEYSYNSAMDKNFLHMKTARP